MSIEEALAQFTTAQRARFFAVNLTAESDVKMRAALSAARRLGASQEQIAAAVVAAAKPVVTRCECFRTSGRGGFPSRIQCGRKALPGTSRCRAHA